MESSSPTPAPVPPSLQRSIHHESPIALDAAQQERDSKWDELKKRLEECVSMLDRRLDKWAQDKRLVEWKKARDKEWDELYRTLDGDAKAWDEKWDEIMRAQDTRWDEMVDAQDRRWMR
ncbi:hypothetical protein BD779DRAFT_1237936 [Infundibulicybe gibba]|nr:hypothetical protein BD779DRAFT_1237936 [Infundibulicybe gibba]